MLLSIPNISVSDNHQGNDVHVQNAEHDSLKVEISSRQVRIPDDPEQMLEYSGETTSYPKATERD